MPSIAARLAGRDLLVDTNVLVLFAVGQSRPDSIGGKRLEKYTAAHFQTMSRVVAASKRVIITPHVLAESSNLISLALYGDAMTNALALLLSNEWRFAGDDSGDTTTIVERHVPKNSFDSALALRLGVADAGLAAIAVATQSILLTDDFQLWGNVISLGGKAVNFNDVWNE